MGVDFTSSFFDKNATFILTYFSGASLFYQTTFAGNVDFSGVKLNEDFFIQWSSLNGHLIYFEPTCLSLIRHFKVTGQFEDARDCYYGYREIRSKLMPWSWNKIIDILSQYSCGYGVRPIETIKLSTIIIIIFGLIYWMTGCIQRSINQLVTFPSNVLRKRHRETFKMQTNMSLLQLIYFSLIIFSHAQPIENCQTSRYGKYLITLEDILGWFFLTLLVIVLVNVMITW